MSNPNDVDAALALWRFGLGAAAQRGAGVAPVADFAGQVRDPSVSGAGELTGQLGLQQVEVAPCAPPDDPLVVGGQVLGA